jgi:hypothetical protein
MRLFDFGDQARARAQPLKYPTASDPSAKPLASFGCLWPMGALAPFFAFNCSYTIHRPQQCPLARGCSPLAASVFFISSSLHRSLSSLASPARPKPASLPTGCLWVCLMLALPAAADTNASPLLHHGIQPMTVQSLRLLYYGVCFSKNTPTATPTATYP